MKEKAFRPAAPNADAPAVSENQLKVIKDKYLRDAASVRDWLWGVASNIALGELLAHPDAQRWGVWRGVKVKTRTGAGPAKTVAWRMDLLHEGLSTSREREENFARLMKNLQSAADSVFEAKRLHAEWTRRFYELMAAWDFLPNSPTLMNAGRELQQLSACYVLPVPDSMEGITYALAAQSLIQKSGGGTGFAFSRLRPAGDPVKKTRGVASGAISFMQLFDKMTDVVKQGGTRRGANMGILRYDHPEIKEFISMKQRPGIMENFNVSVAIDEKFMQAVAADAEYDLINPRTGKPAGKARAKEIFDLIVEYAWKTGDPGLVVIDRINASGSNPTPALGQIEATNPCFTGSVRLATDRGLLSFEELYLEKSAIAVATDNRVPALRALENGGGLAVQTASRTGVTVRQAVPVFKTRKDWPVFRLETEHGLEVTATEDHKFFTPNGLKALKDLKPGDDILIQSAAGVWSRETALPPFLPDDEFAARVRRGEARPPTRWSAELGQLLGWLLGDGWVSAERPQGRKVPNYTVGLMFGAEEKRLLAPKFRALVKEWTGLDGTAVERNGTLTLYYNSALYHMLSSFGECSRDGLTKEVPNALWRAPREAIVGFLQALFTADGTVNVSAHKASCSVRLVGSSKKLLSQVQLLLLNEGIVAKLYTRREAGARLLPDAKRQLKSCHCAAQYELVVDGQSRDRFLAEIGFLVASKQERARAWLAAKRRRSNRDSFTDKVRVIEPAGTADVYCTTEPETHSIIANGLVTAQCGEQPLLPWEPCNLGSLNLSNFVQGGRFDFKRLGAAVRLSIRFLDDVIEVNNYPLAEIEALAKGNRRIGLGVMGLAEAFVKMGIAYDSPEALEVSEKVMRFINDTALSASEDLAAERGVFPNWKDSIYDPAGPHFRGEKRTPRHCARTTIAPTGTIAIAAGLQGSGIEPFFAIAYTRYNARALEAIKKNEAPEEKDVFFEVNPLFRETARAAGYWGLDEKELWNKISENHKSVRGIAEIPEEVQRLFVSAHDVPVETHVRIQAAFQKHVDNGVSKTINMPNAATVADVRAAYLLAYELGLKGITIYRDGSKAQQVLNLSAPATTAAKPRRRDPATAFGVSSEYYQIRTGYGPLHVHINYDELGPYQVFASISPLGTEISALASLTGILLSKYFEQGGDPIAILKHLNSVKGDRPVGFGDSRVNSIAHAISIALRQHLKKTGWLENGKDEEVKKLELETMPKAEHCPKCYSSNVAHLSGCSGPTCQDCGHSECS